MHWGAILEALEGMLVALGNLLEALESILGAVGGFGRGGFKETLSTVLGVWAMLQSSNIMDTPPLV